MTTDQNPAYTLGNVARTKEIPAVLRQKLGERVRRWVAEVHNNNQSAAGRALGVTPSHISSLISGRRGVGLHFLVLFQEELRERGEPGVTLDQLLGIPAPSPRGMDDLTDDEKRIVALIRRELEQARTRKGDDDPASPSAP